MYVPTKKYGFFPARMDLAVKLLRGQTPLSQKQKRGEVALQFCHFACFYKQ